MTAEYNKILSTMGAENILKDLVTNHILGIGVWNMTRKEFNVLENITSHAKRSYTSLIDFIKEICEPCDAEMVISDLKQYMQDSQGIIRVVFV